MNPFEHFILTRFNVPLPEPAANRLDEGWLSRRFDLFARVCLPSLERQTEGAFQWLVFLDWATPLPFKERMAALTVRHEFLRPVYCSQFNDEILLAEIRRREEPGRVRITTGLDSDDALHPRFVAQVQETARAAVGRDLDAGYYISFPLGCSERNGDFYVRRRRLNPFLSFVSAPACTRTALVDPGDCAVVCRAARPMWCQVFHEDNAHQPLEGIYWPWGGSSEFAPGVTNGFCRPWYWQCAEVVRSVARYLAGR